MDRSPSSSEFDQQHLALLQQAALDSRLAADAMGELRRSVGRIEDRLCDLDQKFERIDDMVRGGSTGDSLRTQILLVSRDCADLKSRFEEYKDEESEEKHLGSKTKLAILGSLAAGGISLLKMIVDAVLKTGVH